MVKLRTLCSVIRVLQVSDRRSQVRGHRHSLAVRKPPERSATRSPLSLRLLVAGQHIIRAFPRGQEIEIAEFLRSLTGS